MTGFMEVIIETIITTSSNIMLRPKKTAYEGHLYICRGSILIL
jgi:hypothetical protein